MIAKVCRLEDLYRNRRAVRIEDECRVTETRTPSSIDQLAVDLARQPPAIETIELVVIGLTRSKASVRRQPIDGVVGTHLTSRIGTGTNLGPTVRVLVT